MYIKCFSSVWSCVQFLDFAGNPVALPTSSLLKLGCDTTTANSAPGPKHTGSGSVHAQQLSEVKALVLALVSSTLTS